VTLVVNTNKEGRHVHDLLADPDVTLLDENASVVDGLGKSELEDTRLEAPLKEVVDLQAQNVIQLVLVVRKNSVPVQATEKGSTLEDALGVLLVEREKDTGRLTDLGHLKLDPPDLTLAAEAVLSEELELSVETLLLERATRGLEGLPVCRVSKHTKKRVERIRERGSERKESAMVKRVA